MMIWMLSVCLLLLGTESAALAQVWTQLSVIGVPPAGGGYANFDAANNRLIVLFNQGNGLSTTEVWVLMYANGLGGTPAWTKLPTIGAAPPAAHTPPNTVYDSATNQLIVYGGCGGNCSPVLSTVHVLTNANGLGGPPMWSLSTTSPAQEGRASGSAAYNISTKRMITFGGDFGFSGTNQNDTRVLLSANSGSSTWQALVPAGNLPPGRSSQSAVYNQARNRMVIFGGASVSCCGSIVTYNDLWALSNADGSSTTASAWTQLIPEGLPPASRGYHTSVYDTTRNIMYVFGGFQWSDVIKNWIPLGDLWRLTNADGSGSNPPRWKQIGQLGTPPGANYAHGAALDPVHQRMIVIGGADRNNNTHSLVFVLELPPTD